MMTHVALNFYKSVNLTINNSIYQCFEPIDIMKKIHIVIAITTLINFVIFLVDYKRILLLNVKAHTLVNHIYHF